MKELLEQLLAEADKAADILMERGLGGYQLKALTQEFKRDHLPFLEDDED